mgnify:CR=1 FL=1
MTDARILVVDDEPNIRDLLSTGLSFAGYQVKTVANGAATISAVLEEEPDLIILDVMLPDMNAPARGRVHRSDPLPHGEG